ncbi:response regulator transcription factor [Paenibacillus mendelii]|uniref:Response regulator transcription factor n=1 Tax=Paenibacillus mendelii TaxID=206163 RepID=A0ABV6J5Q4_9BACL|nr:response regulator transcription factor [Paenibacillus mendelii]MCQ6560083.1 response regulator transcription factor [Paenibacillus mendelii]
MSTRILLVEDDESLHRGIQFTLQQEGFHVHSAHNLAEARTWLVEDDIHLILLDVQLPDGNGFDFCTDIRKSCDTPIIFLTASDQEFDIVRGLDLGGDDYITKPFRLREFLSRVHAVLRRRYPISREKDKTVLTAGGLSLNVGEMRLENNGQEIPLSITEFRLLSLFMTHPRSVLSKDQIIAHVWPDGVEVLDDNTVAVNIRRLREKIEQDKQNPQFIVTVRGAGYRWNG